MAEWHDVCALEALEGDLPVIVDLNGTPVGVKKWGDRVFAVINRCGHAGAPMAYGEIHPQVSSPAPGEPVVVDQEHPEIRCPWHHWGFDLATGACTAPVRRPRLRVYETRVEGGRVFVKA